jgi:hypothetical protein
VTAATTRASARSSDAELAVGLGAVMLVLNFPMAVIAVLIGKGPNDPIIIWTLCTMTGFVQWVLVVPLVYGRIRAWAVRKKGGGGRIDAPINQDRG